MSPTRTTVAVRSAFTRRPQARVAGAQVAVTTLHRAVEEFVALAADERHEALPVRLVNAYSLALGSDDPAYRAVLAGPGVNLPDGAPVGLLVGFRSRAARQRGGRVRGPSFFCQVLDRGRDAELRHFLLGSSEATMAGLADRIRAGYPGVEVVGAWSPPFEPLGDDFYDEAARRIAAAKPDVVWLSLGTPKQDIASAALAPRVGLPVVGVGAAFDFLAGTMPEAPVFFQDHGLEWLHRLVTEPRRLWRRYLFGNVRFLVAVVREELRSRR